MKLEKILQKIEDKKIKDGFVIQYNGEVCGAIQRLSNTTSCFEKDNDINRIYTEGINFGLEIAKSILTSNN